MAQRKLPYGIQIIDGVAVGRLITGLPIKDKPQFEFRMREATMDDLLDAENEADVSKPLNFNTELMCRQLLNVGTFEGPFTGDYIRRLKPADFRILRAAQQGLDALGEVAPASGEES